MLHISPQGIEYIWEKFQSLYMTSATEAWMKRIDKINKTLLHRPTDPDSSVYQELMKKQLRSVNGLNVNSVFLSVDSGYSAVSVPVTISCIGIRFSSSREISVFTA